MGLKATVSSKGNGSANLREYYVDAPRAMYNAVCVDFVDLGAVRDERYGSVKQKVQAVFQLDKLIDEKMILAAKKAKGLPEEIEEKDRELVGKRLLIKSKKMNFSLFPGGGKFNSKPSDLYRFLSDWNGMALPEGFEFDAEDYIGRNATIMVSRVPSKDDASIVYSNIADIAPVEDDAEVLELDDTYVRVAERENYSEPKSVAEVEAEDDTKPEEVQPTAAELLADDEVVVPFGSSAGEVAKANKGGSKRATKKAA